MNQEIKHQLAERIDRKEAEFKQWWTSLEVERQNRYQSLPVIGSDSVANNHRHHLGACRRILDILASQLSPEGKRIIPVGLSIHGSAPTVLVQREDHLTPGWENKLEISEYPFLRDNKAPRFKATFDTTPYGIKASKPSILEGIEGQDWLMEVGAMPL